MALSFEERLKQARAERGLSETGTTFADRLQQAKAERAVPKPVDYKPTYNRSADRRVTSPSVIAPEIAMTQDEIDARWKELNKEYQLLRWGAPTGGTAEDYKAWSDRLQGLADEMIALKKPLNFGEKLEYGAARNIGGITGALENVGDTILGGGANLLADLITEGKAIVTGNDESKVADRLRGYSKNVYENDGLVGVNDWAQGVKDKYYARQSGFARGAGDLVESGTAMLTNVALGNAAAGALSAAGAGAGAIDAASKAAKTGQAISKGLLTANAAGGSTKQALAEGAELDDAIAYGTISGLLEGSIESLAGGVPGLGEGKLTSAVTKVMDFAKDSGFLSAVLDIGGEGLEEVVSAYLDPYAKRVYYDPDAENATLRELGKAFASGAALSAIMQGVGGVVGSTPNSTPNTQKAPTGEFNGAQDAFVDTEVNNTTEQTSAPAETVAAEAKITNVNVRNAVASAEQNGGRVSNSRADAVLRDADALAELGITEDAIKGKTASEQRQIVRDAVNGVMGVETKAATDLPEGTGAMSNPFETKVKRSQTESNTLSAVDKVLGAPVEAASELTYDTVSEQESLSRARDRLDTDYDGEVEELAVKTTWTGEETDMAMYVLEDLAAEARKSGDWSEYTEWRKLIQRHGTEAGRSLQSYAKYSRQTGDGIIREASEALENAKTGTNKNAVMDETAQLADRYDKAAADGDTQALANIIRETAKRRRTGTFFKNRLSKNMEWALERVINNNDIDFLKSHASAGIIAIANDTVQSTKTNMAMTFRRNAMLSKASTIMRNLVSNNVFDVQDTLSRDISVPLDALLSKYTGTRSVAVDKSWFSEAKRKGSIDGLAKSMLEVGLDVDAEGNATRWEGGSNRTFSMSGGVVSRLLSSWEKYMGYFLTTTDQFQKGGIEAETRRGLERLAEEGKIGTADALGEMAQNEALYRTFQDETALSRAVLKMRGSLGRFGEIILPFAKVPSNLAARAFDYSPAGLARGVVDVVRVMKAAKDGTLTPAQQAKAVQEVGRGFHGSALLVGATALALSGILRVSDDGKDEKDKDKAAIDKQSGLKGTQVNLSAVERFAKGGGAEWQEGDNLMSVEFLDPMNAILTTGALLAEDIESEDGASALDLGKRTLEGTIQSVLDLPMMDQIAQFGNAKRYSDADTEGGKVLDAALQFAAGVPASFVPNAVKGVAQSTDPYQRDAYTQDNPLLQAWDNVKAGVPGARNTLPTKTNSYGDPLDADKGVLSWLNNNLLPGRITQYDKPRSETTNVLDELYAATGNDGVYPSRQAPTSVTFKSEKFELSDAEQKKFQRTAGNVLTEVVDMLTNSDDYNRLGAERASEIVADAVSYANAIARQEFLKSKGKDYKLEGTSSTMQKAIDAQDKGIGLAEFFAIKDGFDSVKTNANGEDDGESAAVNNRQFAMWLEDAGWLTPEQKGAARELFKDYSFIPGNTVKYDELTGLGFKGETANAVVEAVSALGEDPTYGQKVQAIMDTDGLSDSERWDAVIAYNGVSSGDKDKAATARHYGVSLAAFANMVSAVQNVANSGDGTVNSKAEVQKAVDMVVADKNTKAILFAMYYSGKENPYNPKYTNKKLDWQYAK